MTMYCFYQTEDKGKWHLALASERNNLVKSKGAKLISALDVDNDFSTQLTADETLSLKQHGDMFFDFDDDLEVCIEQFKKFLVLLQSKGVDLNAKAAPFNATMPCSNSCRSASCTSRARASRTTSHKAKRLGIPVWMLGGA